MPSFNVIIDQYIWSVTFFSALTSLAIFSLLILLRFFSDKKKQHSLARRKKIRQLLFIHLSNPLKDLKQALLQSSADLQLVAEEAPAILRTLKGNSYQKLLDCLQSIGLYDWALKRLQGRNRQGKISASHLMAHWPTTDVQQQLKTLLKDDHPLVRYAAIEALAQARDAKLLPIIIHEFKKPNNFSAPLMTNVLQKFGANVAAKLVDYLSARDIPVHLKIPILMALIYTDDNFSTHKAALSLYNHENDELRALAYHGLAKCNKSIAKQVLEAGARDHDWRIRQYTVACATYSDHLPADILSKLLKDDNWLVGFRSGQVLHESGPAGIKLLEIMAKKETLDGRRARMVLAEQKTAGGGIHGVA